MRISLRSCLVFAAGALAAWGGAWFYGRFLRLGETTVFWMLAYDLVPRFVVPVAGGALALLYDRRGRRPAVAEPGRPVSVRLRRTLLAILLLGYAVTWAFGVPSVLTRLTMEEIQDSKGLAKLRPERFGNLPTLRFHLAFPPVPGIVFVFHEAALSPDSGWGGWAFYAWWGSGSKLLGTAWRWIT